MRGAAGRPPVPGLDGGADPGAGRASSSRSTTGTPSGSGRRPDSGRELMRRLQALPGFGKQKAQIFTALLGKQLDVRPDGLGGGRGRLRRAGVAPLGRRRGRPGVAGAGARLQEGEEARRCRSRRDGPGVCLEALSARVTIGTRLLTCTGLAAPRNRAREVVRVLEHVPQAFPLMFWHIPTSSPWSTRGAAPDRSPQTHSATATASAATSPQHLKAVLRMLSEEGVAVVVSAEDTEPPQEGRRRRIGRPRPP